ncbi:hypothetical protein [Microbacterium sp. 1P06AB]|uniref:hypothetical protein n=1 Tax=Microbacterium sp. 1P06AB TaxID=3132289 RepID=UPI0039A5F859
MTRADPPFEPAPRSDRDRLAAARQVASQWRHHDPIRSLADLNDALNPKEIS